MVVLRHDPPDASSILAVEQVRTLFDLGRHEVRMLDDSAVHVDDIKRATWSMSQVDRPEPIIPRGQKFCALVSRFTTKARAVRHDNLAMDKIAGWLAGKCAAVKFRQQVTAVDGHATRRRERSGVIRG